MAAMAPSCSLTVWISTTKHAFVLQISNERVFGLPWTSSRSSERRLLLSQKKLELECSLVGEKIQVDFCLNIEDSTDTSTPSQNSNKIRVKQKESRKSKEQNKIIINFKMLIFLKMKKDNCITDLLGRKC